MFEEQGRIMRGGSIVDVTIISAPSSTKNAAGASVHELDQVSHLVRADYEVVYADAGYQGASKRPDVADDPHLSKVEFRVAAPRSKLAAMAHPDRAAESRKASVRAKVDHPSSSCSGTSDSPRPGNTRRFGTRLLNRDTVGGLAGTTPTK